MTTRMTVQPRPVEENENYEEIDDLTFIVNKTTSKMLQVLQRRAEVHKYYTRVGARVLIQSTHKPDESLLESYVQEYTSSTTESSTREYLPPHIYHGDTGSGKSLALTQFLKFMQAIRNRSNKERKLFDHITSTESIYQSFTTASTSYHNYASRVGKYVELQFDNHGRAMGVKYLDYLLEKDRLTKVPFGESNYHVFYQMLAGVTSDERQHFKLQDASHYHYLQTTTSPFTSTELETQFHNLKLTLKSLGFNRKNQSQIFQILASILHLGNIQFINASNHTTEPALIKNQEVLDMTADFLGLLPLTLENLLTYKTVLIKKEMCTVFLDANDAASQRDDLAKTLYSLLFSWMVEHINSRLCKEGQTNFIGLLDFPGFQSRPNNASNFETFCTNYANERLYNYLLFQIFEASNAAYEEDGVNIPIISYDSNQEVIQLLSKPSTGIVSLIDKQGNRVKGKATDSGLLQSLAKTHINSDIFSLDRANSQFTITHYAQPVTYPVTGFMEGNRGSVGADFVLTFRGDSDVPIGNPFVSALFTSEAVTTETNPRSGGAIVSAQQPNLPLRQPSMKRNRVKTESSNKVDKVPGATVQLETGLDELFDTFDNTETWFVININPNPTSRGDNELNQVERYRLAQMAQRKELEYTVCYQHDEFVTKYAKVLDAMGVDSTSPSLEVLHAARTTFGWGPEHMAFGNRYTYLCDGVWRDLEDNLKVVERDPTNNLASGPNPNFYGNDNQSYYSSDDNDDNVSFFDRESKFSSADDDGLQLTKAENQLQKLDDEEDNYQEPKTKIRKSWICLTWAMTWWIPSSFLSCCGRMKLKEVRMAWREKVTLCILIFWLCAIVILFIVGINPLICPTRDIFSQYEVQGYNKPEKPLVSINGQVFNLKGLTTHYGTQQTQLIKVYAGNDISYMFPMQLSSLCTRYDGSPIDETVSLSNTTIGAQDKNAQYHDHRYYRGGDYYQPDWYQNAIQRMKLTMKQGDLATDPKSLQTRADNNYFWFMLNEKVYDINNYVVGNVYTLSPSGQAPPSSNGYDFMDSNFIDLVRAGKGKDITLAFNTLYKGQNDVKQRTLQCLNNVFYAGVVDDRNSFRCVFAQYILLAMSIFLFAILFVKFLASLQLGSRPEPDDHDKFVILNVPCYTEGEESLKKTIDSLAVLKYDDKRKLLFIIGDGMVMGGGNDQPTPRIVLDILNSDNNNDPEPLSFVSLGEGMKQHNMAKVYTGLYENNGHVVPYLVVVKVGKPSERVKPGNRGKRDSQMILMRFFNKVHYDYPMVPLELEMYHQIKNVIGVDPHFYEFVLMVDADTTVVPDSLNRLISAMLHDTKIMGLCGETALANEKDTWATMIQVYEYFISHHLAKAFESLFGSVTCLPGCFCMYRLRSPTGQPLLVSNVIITDYSENKVDTLHMKNLLHLGEDRYLTTLMLKHFPFQKMTFTPDAMCYTNAPDTWDVLLSQRRRWINSTVHNLLELVFLPRLCGFCCFSMRFVVFMDLLSTVIMPATLGYLGYLLYRLISDSSNIPTLSLVFILAPYVLQMIVFILRRQWQHIGWMIVYLLALPVFAFFIPIYAFWHFDDFSWGNTRIVMGENGKRKKVVVASNVEDTKFDIKSIPTKKWSEYEEEMWEQGTEYSHDSKHSQQIPLAQRRSMLHQQNSNSMVFNHQNGESYGSNNNFLAPRSSTHLMMSPNAMGSNSSNQDTFGSRPGSRANLVMNQSFDNVPIPQPPQNPNNMSVYSPNGNSANLYQMNQLNLQPIPQSNFNNPSNRNSPQPFLQSQSRSASVIYEPQQNLSRVGSPKPNLSVSNSNSNMEDEEAMVYNEVKNILQNADLMTVTKKQVRDQLSRNLGRDFSGQRELVNRCIEKCLASS